MTRTTVHIRRSQKGVTLVEMLVGIGIVAVLAVLIFPALTRGGEAAKAARCTSNLRQLAALFNVYVQDHGRFPQVYRVGSSGHWYYNSDFLASMNTSESDMWAGHAKLYLCPSDKNGNKKISVDGETRFLSYGANLMLGSGDSDPEGASPYTRAIGPPRVVSPSKLIMLCDADNFFFNPADGGESAVSHRHRGGLNVAFTDGHIEWRKEITSDPRLLWPSGIPN